MTSLQNHFLLAMPGLIDPNFSSSLIYIADHSDTGTVGLVVNRVSEFNTQALFEKIDLPLPEGSLGESLGSRPVYNGGPVNTNRGFVLHSAEKKWSQTLSCSQEICLTSSRDILESVSQGEVPRRFLLSLGYAGWSAGQLEQEIKANAWLTLPAEESILFEVSPQERLDRALASLGVNRAFLSSQAGHA